MVLEEPTQSASVYVHPNASTFFLSSLLLSFFVFRHRLLFHFFITVAFKFRNCPNYLKQFFFPVLSNSDILPSFYCIS